MKTQNGANSLFALTSCALLLLVVASHAPAAPGAWDTTFAPTITGGAVNAMALQPDGRLIIGGAFTAVNGSGSRSRLARLFADGSPDTTFFNTGSGVANTVWCLAVQTDSRIVIGGDFTAVTGTSRTRVARLNFNGSVDGTFVPTNIINGSVLALAVQSDNKVVIGGSFAGGNFPSWNARLNADGTTDTAFSSVPSGGEVNAIAIQTDGKIVIGGAFVTVNGTARNRIARLNTDGSLDNTFLNGLGGANGRVRCLQIQTDGKILIGGDFTVFNATSRSYVARLNSNGSLDPGFASSPGANNAVYAIAVPPDSSIVIAGGFSTYAASNLSRVARLNADGTRDTSFSTFGINNLVQALAVQSDGGILTGGTFTTINNTNRSYLGRLYGNLYPPEFVTQPVSRSTNVGATVIFSATVNNPTLSLFQWRKDGTNLAGATLQSYTLNNVQLANAGNYSVFVSNAAGGTTSSNAVLQVGIAPAITGTGQPVSLIVTQGQSATFTVTATGTPLNYFWKKGGVFIPGATNASYTIASVVAANAATYTCQVSNFLSSVTSQGATLTIITQQPQSEIVSQGSTVSFNVMVAAQTPLTYQWSKDGVPLTAATNNTLLLSNVQPSQAGLYVVIINNGFIGVASTPAELMVMSASGPGAPGFTGDQFGFGISGPEGSSFVVDASTNLTSWRAVSTNTFGLGMFLFLDPASSTNAMSFYRVSSP